ncbi:39S ribosomal protein L37, mitochondrial [Aplysia californica]|nr:39S ribosomal protein L37, mitochondrial [Aplysia californica]
MLSQCWNTDETRLPKRKAPPHKILWKFKRAYGITATKSSEILLRSLLRLCQSHVGDLPSLAARRQTYQPLLHSHVMYRDKAIVQRESLDCVVSSDSWLPPFAGEDALDESVAHRIPDMWPVLPTVDFTDIHNYELDSLPGFSRERQFGCPHTILQIGRSSEWSVGQCQASQLLTCLLYTAALARHKFGDNVRILPEPISIQHVSMQPTGFLLTFFQLNTLDLDNSEAGVKNLVWTADKCQLFEKILGQPWMPQPLKRDRLVHFDGAAFEPFLAAYLNGCPELASSAS